MFILEVGGVNGMGWGMQGQMPQGRNPLDQDFFRLFAKFGGFNNRGVSIVDNRDNLGVPLRANSGYVEDAQNLGRVTYSAPESRYAYFLEPTSQNVVMPPRWFT